MERHSWYEESQKEPEGTRNDHGSPGHRVSPVSSFTSPLFGIFTIHVGVEDVIDPVQEQIRREQEIAEQQKRRSGDDVRYRVRPEHGPTSTGPDR